MNSDNIRPVERDAELLPSTSDPTILNSTTEADHSDSSNLDPLTATVASAVGGGVAGAAIGNFLAGRQGAAIGAVLGGVAALAFNYEFGHEDDSTDAAESTNSAAYEPEAANSVFTVDTQAETVPPAALPSTADQAQPFHLQQNYELSAETHYQLGVALGRQGRLPEAIAEFQEALELAPASAETHYNLGVALSKRGDLTHGLDHMQQAKELCLSQGNHSGVKVIERAIQTLNTDASGHPE